MRCSAPIMRSNDQLWLRRTKWQGREAYALSNRFVEILTLTGGGHIAALRFTRESGLPTLNPLWIPNWKTIEPYSYRPGRHAARYGPPMTGKLISGIVGHNLCLDYFGAPSDEEAAQGLSIHGEAPSAKWRRSHSRVTAQRTALTLSVRLPVAGLRFSRKLELRRDESVAYFRETVTNERKADHLFHWTQHVTLAPPFLAPGKSRVAISGTKGMTYPHGYEGKSLLASSREFRWPYAPGESGGKVDLTRPFSRRGRGLLATVQLDPQREVEFVAAFNEEHRLLLGYCFRRIDYPWVAIWEENRVRTEPPWNGRCQSRGLEFGSSPMPVTRREAFARGPLFETPSFSVVPARGKKTIQYVAFLAQIPPDSGEVRDIKLEHKEIVVLNTRGKAVARVRASGLREAGLV